ncbi:hypothetical protein GN958_ATG06282 [Phytophthora infestans]|uniref:Uncharacterized protein n=1 Tax=Phytophthora infestans TaxID=4787 RepID=A0A8S9UXP8_PHYIN|nr:hypothetical protein GN958_ATG06282 [Phytophthora infestans]
MALIQLIGQKVDGLRTSHDSSRREIMSQLSVMDGKLTKPPNPPKTHGFAITRKQLDDDLQELRFIAGQSKYVAKRARAVQGEVIVPFTENGNPIDLRNNFQKKANERARVHFGGAQQARARGVVFRCCKSHCSDDFLHEALEEVLQECFATTDFIRDINNSFIQHHDQVVMFISSLLDRP